MENRFVDVTSIEEQQDDADFEQNTTWLSAQLEKFKKNEYVDIVAERGHGGSHEYLVKCKSVKPCWFSAVDLKKFPQLIEAFEKQKGQKSAARDEDEGTRQVPSSERRPLQNRGITVNSAKSDDLLRSSSRRHRPTKHFVESTNEAVERGKTARKIVKKAPVKSVLEEAAENDDDEPEEYAVEKVLKKSVRGARVQYYVSFEDKFIMLRKLI
uniref:Chromo domain-containing protein n=1 Tax=Globodera pallida TaxID=36090 RepID=A0A183CHM6_GLOPA